MGIQLSKPYIDHREKCGVLEVLESGLLVQGKKVLELEKRFASLCGVRYAVAINSGTAALHTALYSIDLQPGDEVITTAFSFVATTNSILMAGGRPVFVDIDEKTFNIDPSKISSLITSKTKAILAVNMYGQPAEYDAIISIAKRNNLYVIEDAAQSVGATYKEKISGNFGDIGCFSFYATKNIMAGEGGMLTTNNEQFRNKAITFRNHGQKMNKKYDYIDIGYNYRMSDIAASILLAQLDKLNTINGKRQETASIYTKAFKKINGILPPSIKPDRTHVYHQYTIRILNSFTHSRNMLKQILFRKGVESGIYYPKALYKYPHLRKFRTVNSMPVVDKVVGEVLSLPVHPLLRDDEINHIINVICSL